MPGIMQSVGIRRRSSRLTSYQLFAVLCALLFGPSAGWWGRPQTSIGVERSKARAVELWKVANETHAASVHAAKNAASLQKRAEKAEGVAASGQKGGLSSVFGHKLSGEEMASAQFAAKEARALGSLCLTLYPLAPSAWQPTSPVLTFVLLRLILSRACL